MKTPINARFGQNAARLNSERPVLVRHTSKPIENRHERRKIREQLRQLGWVHSETDELFS